MSGQEDCLVLNVHTTNLPVGDDGAGDSLQPVMVFFHGGAYLIGSGGRGLYGGERLVDHGVVLVTVNYRLGPLGLLSTGDDRAPGNQLLWDQKMALEWVRDNIRAFGGDPEKVGVRRLRNYHPYS